MNYFARKRDWILVVALLLLSFMVLLLVYFRNDKPSELTAIIEKDGKLLYQVALEELTEPMEVSVGGNMPVKICLYPDGAAFLTAECPDQLCVKTGKLKSSGQCAICLPARISLRLCGSRNKAADAVTG